MQADGVGVMSENDRRYDEIMQRLAERRAREAEAPRRAAQQRLAGCLDDIDAWGKLETLKADKRIRRRCFGPASVGGLSPSPWVGVVAWCRGAGYYGYRRLTLVGIWAVEGETQPLLIVGTKTLTYSAPSYEADAYHRLIRKTFDIYYTDDGSPPPEAGRLWGGAYTPAQRLDLRKQVKTVLASWLDGLSADQ